MSKRKIILLLLLSIMILPKVDAEISIDLTYDWANDLINDSASSGSTSKKSKPILTYKNGNNEVNDYNNGKNTSSYDNNYVCTYKVTTNLINKIVVDAIDNNNNTILENNKTTTQKEITAGTWIGVNAYETVTSTWTVDNFQFYKKQSIYTCTYKGTKYSQSSTDIAEINATTPVTETACTISLCKQKGISTTIKAEYSTTDHKCTCTFAVSESITATTEKQGTPNITNGKDLCGEPYPYNGYTYYYDSIEETGTIYIIANSTEDSTANQDCMKGVIEKYNDKANKDVKTTTTKLIYLDPNNYTDSDGKIKEYDPVINKKDYKISILENCNNYSCKQSDTSVVRNKTTYSGIASKTYEYIINYVCLNTQTGEVTYKNSKCDEKTELQVSNININNKNYWHYFIPMGMTSDSQFYLKLRQKDSTTLKKKQCENLIDNYNDINSTTYYRNIMQPLNNTWKDESLYKDAEARKEADKKLVEDSDGCEIISTISFDVFQDFYKEEVDTSGKVTGFNGFKFYFRQININNPFPNGIADNSYWKDWESDKTNPNLAKSFDKITYSTFNLDLESIRAFNKENAYTSWENMKKDGSSNFVKENVSSSNNNTYYALGGGPKTTISNNSVKYNAGGDG